MRTLRLWFFLLLALPLAVLAARAAPVMDVEFAANPKLNTAEVGQAVKQALIGRRWAIAKEKGNSLEALQTSRGLSAKITVSWTKDTVSIKYLDSIGFDFREEGGQRLIHPNYNKWIGNLQKDIPVFMERIAFTK